MATLYEIDNAILECVDTETGEIVDFERLAELQMERDEKIEKVALWYKNLLADAEMYKAEKMNFANKQKQAEQKAESIKAYLDNALAGTPFKAPSGRVSISYRKSDKVIVDNIGDVPAEFLKYEEPTADKNAIKKAIKEGVEVSGVHIEQTNSMSIK